MTDSRAKRIKEKYEQLKTLRANWERTWQDSLELVLPQKAFITRKREIYGETIRENVFDSTGRRSNQILAAGLQGNLTNPSSRWMKLRMQESFLNEDDEVKIWLSNSEDRLFDIFNASNFHQQIHEYYLGLGAVGTSAMLALEDPQTVVRFSTRPIDEVIIDENVKEEVDIVYRKYKLTSRQAWEKFGADAGKEAIDNMEKGDWEKRIEFIHCIRPRNDFDPASKRNTDMPFESIHISAEGLEVVQESGFMEFPYLVTRFMKVAGDVYGYSPTAIMLPDIKMLNAISKTIIKAAQKIVDPPLVMPHDGFLLPLKTTPGGLNYKLSGNAQDRIEPLATGGNIPVGREMQNDLRESIRSGFFVDLFLTLADKRNMTATEVAERVAEKMLLLGPALGRLQSELLDPVVTRVFNIALRKGILGTPPEALEGRDVVIEYVSPLALAQKGEQVQAIQQWLQLSAGVAQFLPETLDVINGDNIIRETGNVLGVKPTNINSPEVTQALREQRAQAQAAAQEMEMLKAGAGIAKDMATADSLSAPAEELVEA